MRTYSNDEPLTLQEAVDQLREQLPEGFRIAHETKDKTIHSVRIATPFAMPNDERIYCYIEVNDGPRGFLRMHDDGVLKDWLEWSDLYWCFIRNRKVLERDALIPYGAHFTRTNRLSPQVSMRVTVDEVFSRARDFADAMFNAAKFTQDMRFEERTGSAPDLSIPIPALMGGLLAAQA